MRVEREIFRLEMFGRLVVGEIVEENRSQDRALRLDVRRQAAYEIVISGCHNFLATRSGKSARKSERDISPECLVKDKRVFGKPGTNLNFFGLRVAVMRIAIHADKI